MCNDANQLKHTRLIQRGKYVLEIEVDMVLPSEEPMERCYGSATMCFLQEIAERVQTADLAWLQRHGKVFQLVEAS